MRSIVPGFFINKITGIRKNLSVAPGRLLQGVAGVLSSHVKNIFKRILIFGKAALRMSTMFTHLRQGVAGVH